MFNKRSYSFAALFLLISAISLSSCAKAGPATLAALPGLYPTIGLSYLPNPQLPSKRPTLDHKVAVQVPTVVDSRNSDTLITLNGKQIKAQGDPALPIRYSVRRQLQQMGFTVDENAQVELRLEITRWQTKVKDGSLESEAIVFANVVVPGDVIYSAQYEGNSTEQSPKMLVNDLQLSLGKALEMALSKLLADYQLLEILSAY